MMTWMKKSIGRLRLLRLEESGTAAAEFAFVVPLYLIMFVAFAEGGRLLHDFHVVSKAVRDGARYAARLPADCTGFDDAASQLRVQRLTRTGTIDAAASPVLAYWTNDATVSVTVGCFDNSAGTYSGAYEGITQVPTMSVVSNVQFTFLFAGLVFTGPSVNMSAIHSEPHVGE